MGGGGWTTIRLFFCPPSFQSSSCCLQCVIVMLSCPMLYCTSDLHYRHYNMIMLLPSLSRLLCSHTFACLWQYRCDIPSCHRFVSITHTPMFRSQAFLILYLVKQKYLFNDPQRQDQERTHYEGRRQRRRLPSCINEYLAIDSGGNVSDLALVRNCCLARMLPGEAELVSE